MIAADDVGAGYSGLLQIVRLRPEILKVDRDLVGLLGSDPAAEAVLRMLGELGSALDGWLLAEGVETAEQAAVLARLGIPLAQGWFFGPPAPPWPDGDHLDVVRGLRQEAPIADLVGEHARQEMPGEVRRGDNGRPVQIRIDLGTGREPVWVAATTLAASTPVRQALMRALNRIDPLARSAPLCLTDEAGQLVGVVPVDALARAVATSAHVSVPAQVS